MAVSRAVGGTAGSREGSPGPSGCAGEWIVGTPRWERWALSHEGWGWLGPGWPRRAWQEVKVPVWRWSGHYCCRTGFGVGGEGTRDDLPVFGLRNVVAEEACALRGGSGCVCGSGVQGVKAGEMGGRGGAGAWREHCSQGKGDSTAGKGGQSLATEMVTGQGEGGGQQRGQQLAEEPRAGERGAQRPRAGSAPGRGGRLPGPSAAEAAKGTNRSVPFGAGRTEVTSDLDGRRLGLWGMGAALEAGGGALRRGRERGVA